MGSLLAAIEAHFQYEHTEIARCYTGVSWESSVAKFVAMQNVKISDGRAVSRIAMLGRHAFLENACIRGDLGPMNTLRC